jgi:hypothetical protein
MIRSRLGVFAVLVLTLGVVASLAGIAEAEVGAKWLVLNKVGEAIDTAKLPVLLKAEIESLKKEILLTEILKIKVEKTCSAVEMVSMELVGEGKLKAGGKLKFTGCRMILNGVESKACTPHTKGAPAGTLETNALKGELLLHKLEVGTDSLILMEPSEGTTFMTLETSEECAIGEKIPILGKLYVKDCENAFGKHQVIHLIEEGPLTEAWVISKTEEHKMKLDGSALVSLTGAHAGLAWGAMPG